MQSLNTSPSAELHQYKNAVHFGIISNSMKTANLFIEKSHHNKILLTNTIKHNQGLSQKKVKDEGYYEKGKDKETIEQTGITIDDNGNLLIGQWQNNKIEGLYFMFKTGQGDDGSQSKGCICQYGVMKNGMLYGQNYIYNESGTIIQGNFIKDKLCGSCYVVNNNRNFVNGYECKDDNIQCEVIEIGDVQASTKNGQQRNKMYLDISGFKKDKERNRSLANNGKYKPINSSAFMRPFQLLNKLIEVYQQQYNHQNQTIFTKIKIDEHQCFIGFVKQTEKTQNKQQKQQPQKNIQFNQLLQFSGFGVIFRDGWPYKYGTFVNGMLNGMGRVYQTQMNLCDGLFNSDIMIEGFIIDYYSNRLIYGSQNNAVDSSSSSCFMIQYETDLKNDSRMGEYKKLRHLKSFNFVNNYLVVKQMERIKWPRQILCKLEKKNAMINIIQSYRANDIKNIDLSQIEGINQSQSNRVEREIINQMKEKQKKRENYQQEKQLVSHKSSIIKNQFQNNKETIDFLTVSPYHNDVAIKKGFKQQSEYNRMYLNGHEYIQETNRSTERSSKTKKSRETITKQIQNYLKHRNNQQQIQTEKPKQKQQQTNNGYPNLTFQKDFHKNLTISELGNNYKAKSNMDKISIKDKYKDQSHSPTPTINQSKSSKLEDLIDQYNYCQTQRKRQIQGGSTKRTQSQKNDLVIPRKQSGKIYNRSNKKSTIDLHRIYSQYLN